MDLVGFFYFYFEKFRAIPECLIIPAWFSNGSANSTRKRKLPQCRYLTKSRRSSRNTIASSVRMRYNGGHFRSKSGRSAKART